MKDQEVSKATDTSLADSPTSTSPHVIAAESVQAEEVHTATNGTTSTSSRGIATESVQAEEVHTATNSPTSISPHGIATESMQAEEVAKGVSSPTSTLPHVIAAESVQAEEVPTLSLESLQTLNRLQPEIAIRAISATSTASLPAPLVIQPLEYQRGLAEWVRIWWDGLRLFYLPLALLPVLLGSALAWLASISAVKPHGDFHYQRFLVVLLAVTLLQLGANLLNDYYDYLGGIDTSNALGPGNLIQQGLIKPARILSIGITLLVLGGLCGALVAMYGGLPAFGFGALGLLAAYFYSASRHSLSALTLGEVVAFWIFGPLLTLGAYLVQLGRIDMLPLMCSISLGLLLASALYVNDMRDVESDAQAHKHTLATLLNIYVNRVVCTLLLLGAYVPILFLGLPAHGPHLILIALWTLPGMVVILLSLYRTTTPASLHITMHQVLRLAMLFTLLLVVALTITVYWQMFPTFTLPKWLFVF